MSSIVGYLSIFFMGCSWKKKGALFLLGELRTKQLKAPFPPLTFLSTLFLSFLFLSLEPFVIPTITLCTMYNNVYMTERNRFELHLPRLEPDNSDNP